MSFRRMPYLCLVVLSTTWAGVSASEPPVPEPTPPPAESTPPGETIDLRQAAALALVRHPALEAYAWELRAAEARILQAGLRPNPVLSVQVEDLRWSRSPDTRTRSYSLGTDGVGFEHTREGGASPGLTNAETTVALSQVIELGGKRLRRVRAAEAERDVLQWDYEAARIEVLSGVAEAFVALVGAQDRLRLQEELAELAERVRSTTAARVEAGKVSPLEVARAETELAAVQVALDAASRDVAAARIRLAASYGAERPEFGRATGVLEDAAAPPEFETLSAAVVESPELARWADEMAQRLAVLDLERAKRLPDIEAAAGFRTRGLDAGTVRGWSAATDGTAVSLGLRRDDADFADDRENSFVLSASVPLPLFNRNQGGILEAEHRVDQGKALQRSAELRVRSALGAAYEELRKAADTARRIRDEVLPRTADVFDRTQEGYREGKFGYLEVLYAQRTLFDVRRQYVEALVDYHTALVSVERLIGRPLMTVGGVAASTDADSGEKHDEQP